MAKVVNKVIVNGATKLDLTGDTATEGDVASGKTFHKADGSQATGTNVGGITLADFEIGDIWGPTENSTSPASRFGGTWEQITGAFPRFENNVNTGGEDTHQLSEGELAKFALYLNIRTNSMARAYTQDGSLVVYAFKYIGSTSTDARVIEDEAREFVGSVATATQVTGCNAARYQVGSDTAHNNLPTYQNCYGWVLKNKTAAVPTKADVARLKTDRVLKSIVSKKYANKPNTGVAQRYFDETTKAQITDPDFDTGKVSSTVDNVCKSTWIVDKAEVHHYEIVQEYSAGADVELVVDSPEEGHWEWNTESVYGVPTGIDDPPTSDHTQHPVYVEKVSLWHTYTETELAEIAEQKRQQSAVSEFGEIVSGASFNSIAMYSNDINNASDSQDDALGATYEALTATNAKNLATGAFVKAYGRRVARGNIAISDCPSELQADISTYVEALGLIDASLIGTGISWSSKTIKVKRGGICQFVFTADSTHEIPDYTNWHDYVTITGNSASGEIENFEDLHCTYSIIGTTGIVNIMPTSETVSVSGSITAPAKSITVKFEGVDVTYKYNNKVVTELALDAGTVAMINVTIPSGTVVESISDNKGGTYRLDTNNNIAVKFDDDKTITTVLLEPIQE